MQTTKLTAKFLLIIALFTSVTFADEGQMGGGNVTCSEEERDEYGKCPTDDDGSGFGEPIFEAVKEYLASLLG